MTTARWDRCVHHVDGEVEAFLESYLGEAHRRILLVAGAGFDPRSTAVAELIARFAPGRTRGYFLREERPSPNPELVARADRHEAALRGLIVETSVDRIDVFAADSAVIGGRTAARRVSGLSLDGVTDVFVDLSALSIGIAFPIIRQLFDTAVKLDINLHLLVTDEPTTDSGIESTPSELADTIHGFKGRWGLDETSKAACLWMPQLAAGKRFQLEKIRQRVQPNAVCPVLPFPAANPRLAYELIEHYGQEFENAWYVDARDIVYASERGPLDLYRKVLRMDDARRRVFEEVGGSQIVLSPLGSKALAVGALMTALERDFTIMYVEALGYDVDLGKLDADRSARASGLVHIWLHGEAYRANGGKEATEA